MRRKALGFEMDKEIFEAAEGRLQAMIVEGEIEVEEDESRKAV